MADLGYLCVRAWRFGGPHPVGGFGSYDDLLAGYERVSGVRPDLDTVRWWELFGTVWWGVTCMVQASRHLDGETRSVELAAIGRRTAEQEYDTLRSDRRAAGDGLMARGIPTAAELVQALREFLSDDVMPERRVR